MKRTGLLLLLTVALPGCQDDPRPNPIKEAFASTPPPDGAGSAVVFRFAPERRGRATLFRLPGLDEVAWRFEAGSNPVAAVVGFAGDEDLVYTLSAADELVALDLTSGRAHVVDTAVALATLGPTDIPYVVRANGVLGQVNQRSVTAWPDTFADLPRRIWGAVRGRVIALLETPAFRRLELRADGQPAVSQDIPDGAIAVSRWGDAAAIATDSGVVLVDPTGEQRPTLLRLEPPLRRVAFAPAAHRIYGLIPELGELLAIDRFNHEPVDTLTLPGAAHAFRLGPLGRRLLIRPAEGTVTWVVDLVDWELEGTVETLWNDYLPAIAPDGTILVRRDAAVAALAPETFAPLGRAAAPGSPAWLFAAWDPRRPALELATDSAPQPERPGQLVYLQVSSTSNPAWAEDLAERLQQAGMQARVLTPSAANQPYRVVLGPYPSRDEAEEIQRKLGMPSWIFTEDTTRTTP